MSQIPPSRIRFQWLRYYGFILWFALRESLRIFGHPIEMLGMVLMFALTVGLTGLVFPWEAILKQQLSTTGVWVVSAFTVFLLFFIFNLIRAPYVAYEKQQTETTALEKALQQQEPVARLVEQIRPKFQSLTRDQLREVRFMLPVGISAGTGENQILESVFRDTALVRRVSGIGNYEIPGTALKEALGALFAEPRLELTYHGGADDHRQSRNGSVFHHVVRLRLENVGTSGPVKGIKAKSQQFLNYGEVPLYGTPLQISNDQTSTKREGFLINPSDFELIDVVQKTKDEDWIVLCHALGEAWIATQLAELLITVIVTASTGTRLEATLWIWVNEEGLLDCEQVA